MNLSKVNRLKLAKLIMKFGEVQTDNGMLSYEGELVVGCEVFVETDGELTPAGDGEYVSDNTIYIVEGGIVKEIKQKESEPIETPVETEPEQADEMVEETETDPPTDEQEPETTDDELATLKQENEELKQKIAELEQVIAEYKEKESKSEGESIQMVEQSFRDESKGKQGLKYFENMISKR